MVKMMTIQCRPRSNCGIWRSSWSLWRLLSVLKTGLRKFNSMSEASAKVRPPLTDWQAPSFRAKRSASPCFRWKMMKKSSQSYYATISASVMFLPKARSWTLSKTKSQGVILGPRSKSWHKYCWRICEASTSLQAKTKKSTQKRLSKRN